MATGAIQVTAQVKDLFFDRVELNKRIDQGKIRGLSRQGAFLRTRVRTKVLRRRKTASMPGQPPNVHSSGFESLRNILFFYDPRTGTVVVGPRKLNQTEYSWIDVGTKTVPEILEHGDVVILNEQRFTGLVRGKPAQWRRRDRRMNQRSDREYRKRRVVIKKRPFMAAGLRDEVAAGNIPAAWGDVVRG